MANTTDPAELHNRMMMSVAAFTGKKIERTLLGDCTTPLAGG